jgi:hypothetical protein
VSNTAHSDTVDIFVNETLARAERGSEAITTWPDGSIIVKDGYAGSSKAIVAVMEKSQGSWFFAEYDGSGNILFSGAAKICLDCHSARENVADWLFTMEFPR